MRVVSSNTTIDLNGHTISSNAKEVFRVTKQASLEILGKSGANNKIVSTAYTTEEWSDDNTGQVIAIRGQEGKLTIGPEVTIAHEPDEAEGDEPCQFYGVSIFKDGTSEKSGVVVNMTGTTIEGECGITVLGGVETQEPPIINLTNVKIKTKTLNKKIIGFTSIGIYQAGSSTFNVVNCDIESDCEGIETRAGNLNVSNSTIKGGSGDLDITSNNK